MLPCVIIFYNVNTKNIILHILLFYSQHQEYTGIYQEIDISEHSLIMFIIMLMT